MNRCEIDNTVMCRACLTSDGILLPMYSNGISQRKFPDKLANLACIEIDENDGMPSVLCSKCAYRTDAFYSFKRQVQASDEKLRKLFGGVPAENPSPIVSLVEKKCQLEEKDLTRGGTIDTSDVDDYMCSLTHSTEKKFGPENFVKEENSPDPKYYLLTDASEFSTVKDQPMGSRDDDKNELSQFIENDLMDYTLCYIPSDAEIDFNEDEKSYGSQMEVRLSGNSNSWEGNKEIRATQNQDISDSNDDIDPTQNLLGTLNDTVTKIREVKSEKGLIEYQCTLCVQNYDTLTSVLTHTVDNHVPITGPFFCVVCEKDCDSHKQLRAHVKEHTGDNPYACFLCEKAYTTRRYLRRHMVCHPNFARHRCAKCAKRFKLKSELDLHVITHLHGAPYSCNQCLRVFNHKGNYKRHLISHLDPQGLRLPKYPCTVCGKRFLNNRTLQTHVRVHTGEKPFSCNVCKRSFSQQGNLLNHTRIHSNPRSYPCEVCGKRFNQRSTLRDHNLLHTGEKPYICNICGSAFTFSAALRRHMWSHAGDKPFGCHLCESRFVGRYDLNRHMKIHSDKLKSKRRRNSEKTK